jgi:hypothetical protein
VGKSFKEQRSFDYFHSAKNENAVYRDRDSYNVSFRSGNDRKSNARAKVIQRKIDRARSKKSKGIEELK